MLSSSNFKYKEVSVEAKDFQFLKGSRIFITGQESTIFLLKQNVLQSANQFIVLK